MQPADLNAEFDNILNNPFSLISPVTSDITWNDSINATFGTGGDADIRYDGTDLLILPAVVGTGDLRISGGSLRTQDSEGVWFGTGDDARIYYDGTNFIFDSDVVGTGQFIFQAARMILLNETLNANMTTGLTINQGGADNQILCFKSSDVASGLTTLGETDDFTNISKIAGTGGTIFNAIRNDGAGSQVLQIEAAGGTAATDDTTASLGLIDIVAGEHDGANAWIVTPANANLLTVQAHDNTGYVTRLLLKADDGELHLGNTTLVALDEEDDIGLIRAMQREVSGGRGMKDTPWDNIYGTPVFNYEALRRVGVLGEKDDLGRCLFRVQPRFAMNEGAIWQLATNLYSFRDYMEARLETIEQKLLEAN